MYKEKEEMSGQRDSNAQHLTWKDNALPLSYARNNIILFSSTPNGNRTRVPSVKGRCPWPLDDRGLRKVSDAIFQ